MRVIAASLALMLFTGNAYAGPADPTDGVPGIKSPSRADASKEGRVELGGVSGAESAGPKELTTSVDVPDFEYRIDAVEAGGGAVDDISLAVEPLVDENGKQYRMRWGTAEPKEQDYASIAKPMAPMGRRTVVFRGTLPDPGTYVAAITPYWSGAAHQKIVLKVVRRRPNLSLAVSDPSVFAQDGNTEVMTFPLTLQETAGRPLRLGPPVLVSLVENRATGATTVAVSHSAELSVAINDEKLDGERVLAFDGGESKVATFQLANFPGPGRYDAKIRFSGAGMLPLEKAITLYVRLHFLVAVFWIALGVLASFFLKWWVSKEGPRLGLLERASRLAPDLLATLRLPDLDESEDRLGRSARSQLTALLQGVKEGRNEADATAVDKIVVLVRAVCDWIALHQSVRKAPSGEVREQFLAELDPIRDDLDGEGAPLDKLKADHDALRSMPSELNAAIRKQGLLARMEKMRLELAPVAAATMGKEVGDLLAKGELDAAADRLRQEEGGIVEKKRAARALAGVPMGENEADAARTALMASPFTSFRAPVLEEVLAATLGRPARGWVLEAAVNAAILVIAILLGMKALYVDDLAWGGIGAFATAFLWGLGLHQFTYNGIGSVADKIAKAGSA